MNPIGLYFHIPFCRKKCDYCSFYSVDSNFDLIDAYVLRLIDEIQKKEIKNHIVDTIYFGGGTPTIIGLNNLNKIFSKIFSTYSISTDAEITVEMNPNDLAMGNSLVSMGVNRLVLGVQTLNLNAHQVIGRSSELCTKNIVDNFMKIQSVHCADIISGIPGNFEETSDIHFIAQAGFEHISGYMLTIEKNTPISVRIIDNDGYKKNQRESFEKVIDMLTSNGYNHYEVSNFCKIGNESKHNMKYWLFDEYIGFGPGAHSFYNGERFYNDSDLKKYLLGNFEIKDEKSEDTRAIEFIMTGLRLKRGIAISDFLSKTGSNLPDSIERGLRIKVESGECIEYFNNDKKYIRVSDENFFDTDAIIYKIVENCL